MRSAPATEAVWSWFGVSGFALQGLGSAVLGFVGVGLAETSLGGNQLAQKLDHEELRRGHSGSVGRMVS